MTEREMLGEWAKAATPLWLAILFILLLCLLQSC